MLTNQKITDFLQKTAAGTAVPGGGSVSALSAALGAGLTEMVANLTIAKKGYAAVENEMKEIAETGQNLREKLVSEVDKDSNAYKDVLAAFKLPKNTDEEKAQRIEAIQDAMKNAARVPLAVANDALQIMELAEKVIRNGNRNAVSDGAVGVMMARTAVLGALFNVKINLASIKDEVFVEDMMQQVNKLESRVHEREKEILSHVNV
ncbi:Formiminotetrahydrofolate cyclodeaminase (EC [Olavius sp. associated proteobacterium Delta 1]|nr:Formiminotetrahydrofolate cyclodeaminase (EC [Olavius sp. associated proteobacterium Delta 1]